MLAVIVIQCVQDSGYISHTPGAFHVYLFLELIAVISAGAQDMRDGQEALYGCMAHMLYAKSAASPV